jgi:hypothetical protein
LIRSGKPINTARGLALDVGKGKVERRLFAEKCFVLFRLATEKSHSLTVFVTFNNYKVESDAFCHPIKSVPERAGVLSRD